MRRSFYIFGLVAGAILAGPAGAVTVPDSLFLENDGNRADGGSGGDIGSTAFGTISGTSVRKTGIAGRIRNGTDTYTFTSLSSFDIEFSDLAFPGTGVDIDGCAGFDSTDCSSGSDPNAPKLADFSLTGQSTVSFTSSVAAGTEIFTDIAAGNYTFKIDGSGATQFAGSAYDILITTQPGPQPQPIPVPASLPLLVGALGAFGLMRRRTRA